MTYRELALAVVDLFVLASQGDWGRLHVAPLLISLPCGGGVDYSSSCCLPFSCDHSRSRLSTPTTHQTAKPISSRLAIFR